MPPLPPGPKEPPITPYFCVQRLQVPPELCLLVFLSLLRPGAPPQPGPLLYPGQLPGWPAAAPAGLFLSVLQPRLQGGGPWGLGALGSSAHINMPGGQWLGQISQVRSLPSSRLFSKYFFTLDCASPYLLPGSKIILTYIHRSTPLFHCPKQSSKFTFFASHFVNVKVILWGNITRMLAGWSVLMTLCGISQVSISIRLLQVWLHITYILYIFLVSKVNHEEIDTISQHCRDQVCQGSLSCANICLEHFLAVARDSER